MEVFSTVVAEISASACALLPTETSRHGDFNDGTTCAPGCTRATENTSSQCAYLDDIMREDEAVTTDRSAKFLQRKLQELNVSVAVIHDQSADLFSSLKLQGSWSEICVVRAWLIQLIQEVQSNQPAHATELFEVESNCAEPRLNQSMELPSVRPRRSLRNCRTSTQDIVDKHMLLPDAGVSEWRNVKQSKQRVAQKKKSKMSRKASESTTVNVENTDKILASYETYNAAECDMNVNHSVAPLSVEFTNTPMMSDRLLMEERSQTVIQSAFVEPDVSTSAVSSHHLSEAAAEAVVIKSAVQELQCESCDYVTTKQRSLHMHVARSHGQRSYVCPICQRTFAIAKDLNKHVKFHSERYCCELCGQTLRSKYALRQHIARIHHGAAPRPARRYLCTLCGKMCRSRTDYNVHKNKEHTGVRPFHCNVCSAEFFSRSCLRTHLQVHSDERVYKCVQCGKAFKQRQGLRIHAAVHAAERPYRCERCSKTFTQRGALVRHARTHTSERPFKCRLCPATFNDNSILRRHLIGIHKTHDGAARNQTLDAVSPAVCSQLTETDLRTADSDVYCSTAFSIDVVAGITLKPDSTRLVTSASQLLAVLTSTPPQCRSITAELPTSSTTESMLPQYFLLDSCKPADSQQP